MWRAAKHRIFKLKQYNPLFAARFEHLLNVHRIGSGKKPMLLRKALQQRAKAITLQKKQFLSGKAVNEKYLLEKEIDRVSAAIKKGAGRQKMQEIAREKSPTEQDIARREKRVLEKMREIEREQRAEARTVPETKESLQPAHTDAARLAQKYGLREFTVSKLMEAVEIRLILENPERKKVMAFLSKNNINSRTALDAIFSAAGRYYSGKIVKVEPSSALESRFDKAINHASASVGQEKRGNFLALYSKLLAEKYKSEVSRVPAKYIDFAVLAERLRSETKELKEELKSAQMLGSQRKAKQISERLRVFDALRNDLEW